MALPRIAAGFIVTLRPKQPYRFVVRSNMLTEIAWMPVDIARTYLEVRRLRKEVQEAEHALRVSCARSPHRGIGRINARGVQRINAKIPVVRRGRN
jgi:hypothetical protein